MPTLPYPDYPTAVPLHANELNYNHRPAGVAIDAIVLHATVGSAQATIAWFRNPKARVSAHYVISKAGTVYQLVPESARAWHAGKSEYLSRTDWNDFSIGIELVNKNNGRDGYPIIQVCSLIDLCRDLVARHPAIQPNRIVTHAQISNHLTGKTDPRKFPLDAVRLLIYQPQEATQ